MLELRQYKACDAHIITMWLKNEYAFRQWSADRYESYPITAEDMNSYYSQYVSGELYKLTAVDENEVIGHLTIRFIDEEKKIARLGFVIVDDGRRGKGYGKQLVLSALKYAFDELRVNKVTLKKIKNNKPAVNCYLSCGFKTVKREITESYQCMGEIWKCIEMETDKSDFIMR